MVICSVQNDFRVGRGSVNRSVLIVGGEAPSQRKLTEASCEIGHLTMKLKEYNLFKLLIFNSLYLLRHIHHSLERSLILLFMIPSENSNPLLPSFQKKNFFLLQKNGDSNRKIFFGRLVLEKISSFSQKKFFFIQPDFSL